MSADTPSDGGGPPGPPAFATNHEKPPDRREQWPAAAPRSPKSPSRFRQAVHDIRNTASAAVKGAVNGLTGSPRKALAKAPKKRAPTSDDDASGSDDDGTTRSTTPTPANKRSRRSHTTPTADDAAFFATPQAPNFTAQELQRMADSTRSMLPAQDEHMTDAHAARTGLERVEEVHFEDFNAPAKESEPAVEQERSHAKTPTPDAASGTGAEHDDIMVDREAVEDALDAVLIDVNVATLTAYPELIEMAAAAHRALGRVLAQLPADATSYKPVVDTAEFSAQLTAMATTLDALKTALLAPSDEPAAGKPTPSPKTSATQQHKSGSRFVPSANPVPIAPKARSPPTAQAAPAPKKTDSRRYNPARAIFHPVVPLTQLERISRTERVADDVDKVNEALRDAASDDRKPQVVGLSWTEAGNVVLLAADGYSGKDLVTNGLIIGEALGLGDGFRAYENTEWHKATLRRVPTHGPGRRLLSDDDVLEQLKRNAQFNAIKLVDIPTPVRWLASPEARENARHSSLVVCMATADDLARFRALNKRIYVYGQECGTAAFEERNPITTCTNCWSIVARHRTRDCRSDPRCKFCAGPHHTESHECRDCAREQEERAEQGMDVDGDHGCTHIELRCCNCSGNHPADYPWCDARRPAVGSSAGAAPLAGRKPAQRKKKPATEATGRGGRAPKEKERESGKGKEGRKEKEDGRESGKDGLEKATGDGEGEGTGAGTEDGRIDWATEMEENDTRPKSVRSTASKVSLHSMAKSASSSALDAQDVDTQLEVDDDGFTTVVNRKKRASKRASAGRTTGPSNADMDRAAAQLFKLYPQCPQAEIRAWVRTLKDEATVTAEIKKWYAASGIELRDGTKAFAPSKTPSRASHA